MASKEAQKLFDRRRTGLDRKARDLIMKSLSMHNVDLGITIIYEFGEEVSMFRSHLDDGRWWSTVQDLVSLFQLLVCKKYPNLQCEC